MRVGALGGSGYGTGLDYGPANSAGTVAGQRTAVSTKLHRKYAPNGCLVALSSS